MTINWTNSDEYYYADVQKGLDKKEAIRQLVFKILQLSKEKSAWDSVILDKWIFNLGRLIGNIQDKDEAVGLDRGYRVALKFEEYEEGLTASEDSDEEYNDALDFYHEELENLIIEVFNEKVFLDNIRPYLQQNPIVIEICEQGQRTGTIIHLNE